MKKVLLCLLVLAMGVMAQADLRLFYDFEGGSAGDPTVADKSAYGNDATRSYAGWGAPYDVLPQYVPSHDGSTAMQFGYTDEGVWGANGAYNHLNVGSGYIDSLGNLGGGFAMAFWARQDQSGDSPWFYETSYYYGPAYARVISCPNYEIELGAGDIGDSASYFWPYGVDPGYGDPTSWQMGMATNPEDAWFHMAITYDGTTFTQYINGIPVFSNSSLVPFDQSPWTGDNDWITMKIGAQCTPDKSWMIGLLDDVAIWGNCYLDADAVAGLYDGTYTPLTAPTTAPEPASLALLALGGILLRKRSY